MSEKKDLTNETTIDSLKEIAIKFSKDIYVNRVLANAINFIQDLKAENESFGETINEASETLRNQRAKIERLTKANEELTSIAEYQQNSNIERWRIIQEKDKEIERLEKENEEQHKRIMELEQDLVHADEKVFYRECDVALNETKLKDKGALELAQQVEAYLAYYQGESFTTEQILDIIKRTLIEDFNFKEQTNEN